MFSLKIMQSEMVQRQVESHVCFESIPIRGSSHGIEIDNIRKLNKNGLRHADIISGMEIVWEVEAKMMHFT